jgi:hypothetical protein
MTILVVSNWHERPDLLLEQLDSYDAAFDGDLIHCVNINHETAPDFHAEAARKGIDFGRRGNLHFTTATVRTGWARVAHAFFQAVLDCMRHKRSFDYVYFHTASDLMIRPGANRHVRGFDLGFGRSGGSRVQFLTYGGVEYADNETNSLAFRAAMRRDPRLARLLRSLGLDRIHKSRSEGCFFRRDIYFEIMYPTLASMSLADMEGLPGAYPIEEYVLATCVEEFCARSNIRRTRHMVHTSHNEKNRASVEDMDAVRATADQFGIKRFDPDIDHPVRDYARKLLAA